MTVSEVDRVATATTTREVGLWCFACGDVLDLDGETPLTRCTCGASTLKRSGDGFLYSGAAEGVARDADVEAGDAVQYVRRPDDEMLHREQTGPLI